MKLKRTKKDYGGGGGKGIFKSDFFRVVLWVHGGDNGKRTEIEINSGDIFGAFSIYFDGHHEFKSDSDCINQLTPAEILKLIKLQKKSSFSSGKKHKIVEIRECLSF